MKQVGIVPHLFRERKGPMGQMDKQRFVNQVKRLYIEDPGVVSSIAYHKLERFLQEAEVYCVDEGECMALYAIRGRQLIFYWSQQDDDSSAGSMDAVRPGSRHRESGEGSEPLALGTTRSSGRGARLLVPSKQLQELDLLILHADYYRLLEQPQLAGYDVNQFYPLFYDPSLAPSQTDCKGYYVDVFEFQNEQDFQAAAEIITETNTGYTVTAERVKGWTKDKAFDPTLWLMARERQSGESVGVGISCYYGPIKEADLDWFFVRPDHQGRGIGRKLIAETIARCQGKSQIIRLAGIADGFYQKCGFQRRDSWYYLKKRK